MRRLVQPGPISPSRIDVFRGDVQPLQLSLQPGMTLNEALTAPLVAAGFQSGTIVFKNVAVDPFRYVRPGPADDASHVAYFSAPHAPAGVSWIEQGNATFGWSGEAPAVHCHAVWREPDGARRGGHILPLETRIAAPAEAVAWGFRDVRIAVAADAETNFSLFQPAGGGTTGTGLVVRVKPNEDILTAMETAAAQAGLRDVVVRGSLGSLIGAHFVPGGTVADHATEVLVRDGFVRDGQAALDLLVVDMGGRVHEGWLVRGDNPVCITFDLVLQAA